MSTRRTKPPIPDLLSESEALAVLVGGRGEARLSHIPVEQLEPNPFNPRQHMDVAELVESMRVHGFMGALDGRRVGERVQLAYGARRLMAARQAGIRQVPVYLHDWDDQMMLVLGLVENVQREDLAPLEAASTVKQMHEELGWSQEEIAQRTGKNRSWVRDMLALAEAPEDLRQLVKERPDASRHVRYLAQVEDKQARAALIEAVREREVTAQQLFKAVQAVEAGLPVEAALQAVRSPALAPSPVALLPTEQAAVGRSPEGEMGEKTLAEPRGPQVRAPADVVALLEYIAHRLARLALADLARAVEKDAAAVRRALAAVQEELDQLKAQVPKE
jgi:ParB family chromosome partitioning protein